MNVIRAAAFVLIVGGVLAMVFEDFSFTRETHRTEVGPVEFSVKDEEQINLPRWAGAGAILAGGFLLFVTGRGKK